MMPVKTLAWASLALVGVVACSGDDRPFEEALEASQSNIASLEVVPLEGVVSPVTIGVNQVLRLTATARNGAGVVTAFDASDRDWRVSDSQVARIDRNGLLTGLADGSVSVALRFGGIEASALSVNVSSADLVAITEISGSAEAEPCLAAEYLAIGAFSDGSERTLSNVVWSIDADADAELISEAGDSLGRIRLIANTPGTVTLAADSNGASTTRDITVVDTLAELNFPQGVRVVTEGNSIQLAASAVYTRDTGSVSEDVTNSVSWSVADGTGSASVSNGALSRGLLTGTESGLVNVTAECGEFRATQTVQVLADEDDEDSDGLVFSVGNTLTVALSNGGLQLQVSTGSSFDADNEVTDEITWQSTNPNIADISPTGVLTPINAGFAQIIATRDGEQVTLGVTVSANL